MTKDEALAHLRLDAGYSDAQVKEEYQSLYNHYRLLLDQAPTPTLKEIYRKNLGDLKTAMEMLLPGSSDLSLSRLPATHPIQPLEVKPPVLRTEPRSKSPNADAGLPRSTMIAFGVAALLAGLASFFAIVWIQGRQGQPAPATEQSGAAAKSAPLSGSDEARKAAEVERIQLEVERQRLELEKARREDAAILAQADQAKADAIRRAEEARVGANRSEFNTRIENALLARKEEEAKWEAQLVDDKGNRYPGIKVAVGAGIVDSAYVLNYVQSSEDLERGAYFSTDVGLVNRAGEVAFRFKVLHVHARECRGLLYISPTRVTYDPVETPNFKGDAFDVSRNTLRRLGARSPFFKIETPQRAYDFAFSAQESGGKKTWWSSTPVREWAEAALLDHASARQQFDRAVADVVLGGR